MDTMDFLNDADLVPTGTTRQGRAEFRLTRALIFGKITVPAGFITDKFSLPGRLIPFIWQPHKAKYATPAVVHDWLYETMWFGPKEEDRENADNQLMQAMIATGVTPAKRWIVWGAVRAFGARGYGLVDAGNVDLVRAVRPDLSAVLA